MPDQPAIYGSRTFQGPGGGGEGPWIFSRFGNGPGTYGGVTFEGVLGDYWVLWGWPETVGCSQEWAGVVWGPIQIIGRAGWTSSAISNVWLVNFTGDGLAEIKGADGCPLALHKMPTDFTYIDME